MKALAYHTIQALINTVLAKSPEAPEALKKLQNHSKETKVKTALKNGDVRFDKDMQIVPIGVHGGKREGAGRKAVRGRTTVTRVPSCYLHEIKALIEHLDGTMGKEKDGHTSRVQSRNLNNILLTVTFQSKSAYPMPE